MAVVETLEIRFRADMGALNAQLSALSTRIGSLGKAMSSGKADLSARAAEMVRGMGEALCACAGSNAAAGAAGSLMAGRFAQGVLSGSGLARGAAQQLCAAAKINSSGAAAAAHSAGAAVGQGFANGISGKYGAVMAAANRIANAAVSRIRSALSIHSPSKVTYGLGSFFGEGFAEGVCDSIHMAEESAAALSAGAAQSLRRNAGGEENSWSAGEGLPNLVRAAVAEAMGGTEIVIPLNVDGMKLGEASIRGINLVTRSAGRVLLEI